MGVLARAEPSRIAELAPDLPGHDILRGPEIGSVMVRGRVGGTGAPFNLGEMTVTRCSIRLKSGKVGHAHVQGRSKDHALRAALIDAMLQGPEAEVIRATVIRPLEAAEREARQLRAAKAAATRVEFFTMVRGEDK